MRGTHWGKGAIGLQAAGPKRPHTRPLTFFLMGPIKRVVSTAALLIYTPILLLADSSNVVYIVTILK